jgi:hypothetical protein
MSAVESLKQVLFYFCRNYRIIAAKPQLFLFSSFHLKDVEVLACISNVSDALNAIEPFVQKLGLRTFYFSGATLY